MRAATRMMLLAGTALAIAACRADQAEQNITITNEIPANADIEALPADESSATPSEELANGAQSADGNEVNASVNGY